MVPEMKYSPQGIIVEDAARCSWLQRFSFDVTQFLPCHSYFLLRCVRNKFDNYGAKTVAALVSSWLVMDRFGCWGLEQGIFWGSWNFPYEVKLYLISLKSYVSSWSSIYVFQLFLSWLLARLFKTTQHSAISFVLTALPTALGTGIS